MNDPRIVNQHIEPAERIDSFTHRALNFLLVSDIARNNQSSVADLIEFPPRRIESCRIAADERQVSAFAGESQSDFQPQTSVPPGNHHGLSSEGQPRTPGQV